MKRAYLFLILLIFSGDLFPRDSELQRKIEDILRAVPSGTKYGVFIYNPLTRDTIYAKNETEIIKPASNEKLFTTGAALALMGGDFKVSTKLFTDDPDISDGVINGNLYLKGFGNSLFTDRDIDSLVYVLRSLGIHNVTGSVIGDDSYFDDIYHRKDWILEEMSSVPLPPISAIVVNRNKVQFSLSASSKVGGIINVSTSPGCSLIRIRVNAKTTRSRSTVSISQHYSSDSYEFVINGGLRRNSHMIWYSSEIENPPLFAAYLLQDRLIKAGITVMKHPSAGITPQVTKELGERFVTLRNLTKVINKPSDNFLAECLFKTVGAYYSHSQGNSFYATQAITSYLNDNEINNTGLSLVDGSGLSHYNQVTVSAIVQLLEKIYLDNNVYPDYLNSLSIAGVDGTLRGRMIGTFAENNFHGKTGTLNGVIALSGYLSLKSREDLIVSIIFEYNQGSPYKYRSLQDRIIETLVEL
ncbi:MAG: D-alanyl-D-alanine carboxypeptidase/D-alanyl-D-alanine-endopeptidase [Ignavibacteria bacterium]|jgi:PBP4 family serine-type D-alanyl-D-alanine carboxypeptidase|nr:D-alanyl-D-alanine carboxypeptidase/D-alanyl-D-alanine-endopeptidase [Ignavibacteria bacterium]MCU7502804.1 D-alanyl-D-alanine carboxypeptidase/D-alanyl-D-alanine-endopeptidase [Ignavibacteria bacterium]MCU7517916.1 D-alanyl-D-alanine carboxypeptidase/D-alanyl-D-alanine-endopeptidase [Ignavibacteria bacterium]